MGCCYAGDEIVFEGAGLPLELDVEGSAQYREEFMKWTACVESVQATTSQVDATSAHASGPMANETETTGGDGSRPSDEVEYDDDQEQPHEGGEEHHALHNTSDTSSVLEGTEEEEDVTMSSAGRVLQECGVEPELVRGDLHVSILVSIKPPEPQGTANQSSAAHHTQQSGEGLKSSTKSFFDSFVN